MTPDALAEAVADGSIDTVVVAFVDHHGRLLGKRLDAAHYVEVVADAGAHACDYLLTTDIAMDPVPGYAYANWELGYGDFHLVPDHSTLRRAGWAPGTAWVLCDVIDPRTHGPVAVAPVSVLRRQVARLADAGYSAMAASELEFFVYADGYRATHERGYSALRPAGWYIEDYHLLQGARVEPYVGAVRRALRDSGIAVEGSKGEWGRGQHEVNVRYAPVLEMAGRHAIAKHAMKELAESMGVSVTFMAKPHEDEAGSSCHLHVSLWDGDDPAFATDDPGGDPARLPDVFRWFLGGWMAHVADFMVCYAPTVNSYKRYRDGSWAPTRVAWAVDNRTVGFRVVGTGAATRIECRIPGADVNPYLAYAATIASGLAGIEGRIEPPPRHDGDAYRADTIERVPDDLGAAIEAFAASATARAAFGDDVVDHYAHVHETELRAFSRAVTDWERARYFEQI